MNYLRDDTTVVREMSGMTELCADYFVITFRYRQKHGKEFSFVRGCESEGCLCF